MTQIFRFHRGHHFGLPMCSISFNFIYPGQSGAPVSGDQAPVWICEGSLSRPEEKHGTALHAVCVVQPVDGAGQIDGSSGMSAPENRASALQRAEKAQPAQRKRRDCRRLLVEFHHLKTDDLLLQLALSGSDHP